MKSWLRCILIVNFRVRNKIPKIPNAHQIILKLFRKQNIKGYWKGRSKGLPFLFLCLRARTLESPPFQGGWEGVKYRAHDCDLQVAQSSPWGGTEKEDRKVFLFCFYACGREYELSSSFVLVSLPRGEMCASAFSSGGGGWVVNTEGKAVLCESR